MTSRIKRALISLAFVLILYAAKNFPTTNPIAHTASGPSSPLLPSTPPTPMAKSNPSPTSNESLREELRARLAALPRRADFAKLTDEEAHHYPPPMAAAGKIMGELAERLARDPALGPVALDFYRECVEDGSLPESVRALCLANHRKRHVGAARPALDESTLPARLRRLASSIAF